MIDTLAAGIAKLKPKVTAETITADEAVRLRTWAAELKRLERIHRAETDLLYFALEYFSEVRNPGNAGNWQGFELPSPEAAPEFHKEICADVDHISMVEKNARAAVAAPRSHSKSSFVAKANPLREVVFRKRKYIIIISETPVVASGNLEWIANQLKYNKKLREDFGPLLDPRQQFNPKDNTSEFIAWQTLEDGTKRQLTRVEAASSNQALRGRNWDGYRPDYIICDDLESKRNTNTPELRKELRDWFSDTVMPLGDPAGKATAVFYIGTVLHADSLLNHILKDRADFKSKRYKALIEEPERMDLWEKCREIYTSDQYEKAERQQKARQFYEEHREEMDQGARVLWPEVQPLWNLMVYKWDNGSKAFNTEYQNTPLDEESQVFVLEKLRYYDESDLFDASGRPLPLEYTGFWDIAQGKSNRSDYNAILTIGRDRRTGIMYVIDAWIKRCPAHVALEEAVKKIEEFGHRTFGVETVGAQHDMYRQLQEKLAKMGIYGTKLQPVISRKKKEERIESLEPLCESGFLRFNRGHRLLLEQLEQFPTGSYDDGPDSLAGAVDLAGGARAPRRVFLNKPRGL